jgi:hypothetical protein
VPRYEGMSDADHLTHQRPIQLRVFNVLRQWLEKSFYDFSDALITRLHAFIGVMDRDGNGKLAAQLRTSLKRQLDGRARLADGLQFSAPPPEPRVPRNIFSPGLALADVDEEEVARQLTVQEWKLFTKIKPVELQSQAWSKPKLKHRAPNVLAMIGHFNALSNWVSLTIVSCERLRERAKVMARFIEIARALRGLQNYSMLMAVLAGMNNAAVHRLKFTRMELPQKRQELFGELVSLMSTEGNYGRYRGALTESAPPCIPYLGVYLQDLTFIEDGNPDTLPPYGLINFAKRRQVCNAIRSIQDFQQKAYNLQEVHQIQALLKNVRVVDDQELYRMSLEREPRGVSDKSALK